MHHAKGAAGVSVQRPPSWLTLAPGLGHDLSTEPSRRAAMEDIRTGRGTRYAPAVVDACLRLIEDGTFTL